MKDPYQDYRQPTDQELDLLGIIPSTTSDSRQDPKYKEITHYLWEVPGVGLVCDVSSMYWGNAGDPLICPPGTTFEDLFKEYDLSQST